MRKLCTIVSGLILSLCVINLDAQTICVTKSVTTGSSTRAADCNTVIYPNVLFGPSDYGSSAAIITDVDVTMSWSKTNFGTPGNGEITHRLVGASGTACSSVSLITAGTYSGTTGGSWTTTFDESSANIPSGTPSSGTFNPVGNLDACLGQSPFGSWNLVTQDTRCFWQNGTYQFSGTSVVNYSVEICACIPPTAADSLSISQIGVCDGDTPDSILTVTAFGGNGDIFMWYADSCGDSSIGAGQVLTIPNPGQTTTYFGRWDGGDICGISDCISITYYQQPLTGINFQKQDALCGGKPTGIAFAEPVGGVSPYTFSWSNGATDAFIDSVGPGVYSVVVTDALGCVDTGMIPILSVAPTPPTNLRISLLSAKAARLEWDPVPGAVGYILRGKPVQANQFITLQIAGGSTASTNVFGLNTNTTYIWQLRTICELGVALSGFSQLDTFNIGELIPCPTPASTGVANVTESGATIFWSAVPGAFKYKIQGTKLGSGGLTVIVTNNADTFRNIANLPPNTSYIWQVQAWCTNAGSVVSDLTPVDTFTTLDTIGGERVLRYQPAGAQTDESVSIYPNPMTDQSTISLNGGEIQQLSVYSLSGKLMNRMDNVNANQVILDRADLPKGVYMVEVVGSETHFEKIIVQ